jgi:hypothetical protein
MRRKKISPISRMNIRTAIVLGLRLAGPTEMLQMQAVLLAPPVCSEKPPPRKTTGRQPNAGKVAAVVT